MGFIIVYVTNPSGDAARSIANHLLDRKLIACANIFPIESCFLWKNKKKCENEFVSIFKTREELWDRVREEVEKLHPYDVPCIMKIHVSSNKAYEEWIASETSI